MGEKTLKFMKPGLISLGRAQLAPGRHAGHCLSPSAAAAGLLVPAGGARQLH